MSRWNNRGNVRTFALPSPLSKIPDHPTVQFVSRKNRAVPRLVSITDTLVPFTVLVPLSLVQMFEERSVLNWRVKPIKGAGQETCTRPLLIRFVMERNGNGQTVVVVTLR